MKTIERELMSEEEFKDYLNSSTLNLQTFEAVHKFRSVRRAIKRGHVAPNGVIYPKRPFNNVPDKKGSLNLRKKQIYGQFKRRNRQDKLQ